MKLCARPFFFILPFSIHRSTAEPYDTDAMAEEFKSQFAGQAFHVGMPLAFSFMDKKLLSLAVKEMEGLLRSDFLVVVL